MDKLTSEFDALALICFHLECNRIVMHLTKKVFQSKQDFCWLTTKKDAMHCTLPKPGATFG
jgi:hypothetical protein